MEEQQTKQSGFTFRELVEALAIALVLALLIRTFFLQLFWIPSRSMEPLLLVNDRIIVTKFSYWQKDPQRGEVIVFKFPKDKSKDFIKRVIGLPQETVSIKNNQVYINGTLLEEPYLEKKTYPDYGPIEIPPGHYFVLGDNRDSSDDSRVWGFLSQDLIVGKAQYRYWPLSRQGSLYEED